VSSFAPRPPSCCWLLYGAPLLQPISSLAIRDDAGDRVGLIDRWAGSTIDTRAPRQYDSELIINIALVVLVAASRSHSSRAAVLTGSSVDGLFLAVMNRSLIRSGAHRATRGLDACDPPVQRASRRRARYGSRIPLDRAHLVLLGGIRQRRAARGAGGTERISDRSSPEKESHHRIGGHTAATRPMRS